MLILHDKSVYDIFKVMMGPSYYSILNKLLDSKCMSRDKWAVVYKDPKPLKRCLYVDIWAERESKKKCSSLIW